jgi:hypothetical protein
MPDPYRCEHEGPRRRCAEEALPGSRYCHRCKGPRCAARGCEAPMPDTLSLCDDHDVAWVASGLGMDEWLEVRT